MSDDDTSQRTDRVESAGSDGGAGPRAGTDVGRPGDQLPRIHSSDVRGGGGRREITRDDVANYARIQRYKNNRELRAFGTRLIVLISAVIAVIALGSIAYSLTENSSVAYGFLWTMDTVTTLGSLPVPTNFVGRALLVVLELVGIGMLFYALATVAEFFVSGQLAGILKRRRSQKLISSYSDHYIICGFGRVGRQAARELMRSDADVVVIDDNPAHREVAELAGLEFVEGRASDDETLLAAGIDRAAAIIACVDSDAENIFVTLTARELSQDILVIARASADDVEKKLLRAGADRVISPYKTTGSAMALVALRPQIEGAVDLREYRVEQIDVAPTSSGVGKTVSEVRGGAIIVGIRRASGHFQPTPGPDAPITAGDTIVALGKPQALEDLENLFQRGPVAR